MQPSLFLFFFSRSYVFIDPKPYLIYFLNFVNFEKNAKVFIFQHPQCEAFAISLSQQKCLLYKQLNETYVYEDGFTLYIRRRSKIFIKFRTLLKWVCCFWYKVCHASFCVNHTSYAIWSALNYYCCCCCCCYCFVIYNIDINLL